MQAVNFNRGGEEMENRKLSLNMSEKAREARRRYMAKWRSRNRERVRRNNANYWERQGEKLEAGEHEKS